MKLRFANLRYEAILLLSIVNFNPVFSFDPTHGAGVKLHSPGRDQLQEPGQEAYIYQISRSGVSIELDGELTEQAWQEAQLATGFWMSYPVDDREADIEIQTEVRLTTDMDYLYVGVTCYGPRDYVIKTLKRDTDFWKGDAFGVVIDPVNEKTNGFVFGVSPAGVQTEYLVTGQAGRREETEEGETPNGINIAWDNRWFSVVQNHADRWVAEIAIPFKSLRYDATLKTWGINFFRLDARTNTIHTWSPVPIEFRESDLGYTGILSWQEPPENQKGNFAVIPYFKTTAFRDFGSGSPSEYDFQPGLDAKVPVTPGMNLDVTVNPDFSQVEVDEQVINLTLFDIQLPEKRLFFLENSDVFEDFGIPPMRPFFSRRIGLDDRGNPIPILYGARLSGNINPDLRVGIMNLQSRNKDIFLPQNYSVVAFHQQVLQRSVIKGYLHNRQAFDAERPDYNRNMGLEFQYRSADGRLQAFGGYSKAFNPGIGDRNYYYMTGIGYDNRNISFYTNLAGLGKNYQADLGHITRHEFYDASRDTSIHISMNHWFIQYAHTFYPGNSRRIISHELNARYIQDFDTSFSLLQWELETGYTLRLATTALIRASYNRNTVHLPYPFTFIGAKPLPAAIYRFGQAELSLESDQRRLFSLQAGISYGTFYNGTRAQYRFGIKYRAQPWGNFSVNLEQNDLVFPDPYGTGSLLLLGPRIEINFSRSLFWTTFLQYNTQDDNFNINSRLQWRFQPMSDLYIVYTDNYAVEFWGPKNRALVIKLNYWFNF